MDKITSIVPNGPFCNQYLLVGAVFNAGGVGGVELWVGWNQKLVLEFGKVFKEIQRKLFGYHSRNEDLQLMR